ncbi:MAG: RNA 2',3'-cyclic phosphodiesterase [Candidatus Binatia bacterium]
MIRVFIGVRIEPDVARKIAEAQIQLRDRIAGVRWVAEANYHFTLKFLGPVEENRIAQISGALKEWVGHFSPFVVSARGIGVFPDIRKPRVLWVGLDSKSLEPLASKIEESMESVGFARESRSFKPHLTLGRWRDPAKQTDKLRNEIDPWKAKAFGDSDVKEVVLFQSTLKPAGAVYSELEMFALGARHGEN